MNRRLGHGVIDVRELLGGLYLRFAECVMERKVNLDINTNGISVDQNCCTPIFLSAISI